MRSAPASARPVSSLGAYATPNFFARARRRSSSSMSTAGWYSASLSSVWNRDARSLLRCSSSCAVRSLG